VQRILHDGRQRDEDDEQFEPSPGIRRRRFPPARLVQAKRGHHHGEREEGEHHLVYEVAREENDAGRQREERGGGERADRAEVTTQREREPHRRHAEDDGDETHHPRVEQLKTLREQGERQGEVIERRAVIVARVVVEDAGAHQVVEEEPVDAFVVVDRSELELDEAHERGHEHHYRARDPPRARREFPAAAVVTAVGWRRRADVAAVRLVALRDVRWPSLRFTGA
jgi:hypothetical protein